MTTKSASPCRKRLQPRCASFDIRGKSIAAEAASCMAQVRHSWLGAFAGRLDPGQGRQRRTNRQCRNVLDGKGHVHDTSSLDRTGAAARYHLCSIALDGQRDPSPGAAAAGARRHHFGAGAVHARRTRGGSPGLAVLRWPATRLGLGPRRPGRPGLERRLAASRGRANCSSSGRAATIPATYANLGEPEQASLKATPASRDAHQHLRCQDRTRSPYPTIAHWPSRTWPRTTSACSATIRPHRHCAKATRCARTRCRTSSIARNSPASSSGPAGRRRPIAPTAPSATPATGPTSRWSATRRRRDRSSGPCSACSS